MSSEWGSFQFHELCDITRGASPRPIHDYLGDEGMPWIKIADATAQPSRFITGTNEKIKLHGVRASVEVFPGDLILSNSATPGLPKFLKINACIHDGWMLLRNFRTLEKEYAYWLLLAERSKLVAQGNGSVFTNLKTEILKRHTVVVPPLRVQRSVAATLNALDDRITLLRETNTTLEAIAQALFKSWFVDFDPVRAKRDGRAPEGMDEATAALFPDSFEDSELGAVPRGWHIGKLEDLLLLQRGFDLPAQERKPGTYPIIAASGPSGTHVEAMAQAPGVVTGRSGVLGRVFLALEDYWPLNTTLWVKEFRAATPCYAYEVLRLLDFQSFNAGSAVPTLNRNHVHGLAYLIPDRKCVEAYEALALQLHQRARLNQQSAGTLVTLRDTLLPRLISGQLRLPEATEAVEEALA